MYVLFDSDKLTRLDGTFDDWQSAVSEASTIVSNTTMCVGIYWQDEDSGRLVVVGEYFDGKLLIVKDELERNVWVLRRQIEEYRRLYDRLGERAPRRFSRGARVAKWRITK